MYTLSPQELLALEKALCSADEPETSTTTLTNRISQTDPGFEDSLDPAASSLYPDGTVKLEDLGDILHHTAASGSPVTPITPVIDEGTSAFPGFPSTSQAGRNFNTAEQHGSPTGTLICSLEEPDESLNSTLNKSESKDSGLHSENVSTSDTVLIETGVTDTTVIDQASGYTSSEGKSHDVASNSSSGDDIQNICMKSCCYPENDVCVLCREIVDEIVDQVVLGLAEQPPQFGRQLSCPYNLDFEIPRISVAALPPCNVDGSHGETPPDDDGSKRQEVYQMNWENCAPCDHSEPCDTTQGTSPSMIPDKCDKCCAHSNNSVQCDNACDTSIYENSHGGSKCYPNPVCNCGAMGSRGSSSSGNSSSKDSSGDIICDQGTADSAQSNRSTVSVENTCGCGRGIAGKDLGEDSSGRDSSVDSDRKICDSPSYSTCQHSTERPNSASEISPVEAKTNSVMPSSPSAANGTKDDQSQSSLPTSGNSQSPTHMVATESGIDNSLRDAIASGSTTLETPRIQRLRYTADSMSSSLSSGLSNNENEWDSR